MADMTVLPVPDGLPGIATVRPQLVTVVDRPRTSPASTDRPSRVPTGWHAC